jgi:uncharacterized protein YjeT (DUF2065 family)
VVHGRGPAVRRTADIAFHQYWSNLAAVLISAFGWILALRGLALMAAPELYQRAAMAMDAAPLVRLIFGVLVAIGLYLATLSWLAKLLAKTVP